MSSDREATPPPQGEPTDTRSSASVAVVDRRRGARSTMMWMGMLSVVTLVLGVLREFVIARGLRATDSADLFFRGLVIVGACRNFGLSLFRARWIPLGLGPTARSLVAQERRITVLIVAVALVGLFVVMGGEAWSGAVLWVFCGAVILAVVGSAVRALAERVGYERRGFVLEWALPLGTIAGALVIGRGALGPTVGITVGLAVGLLALVPAVFFQRVTSGAPAGSYDSSRTRWLLLDTLFYINLGLLDAVLSPYIFDAGDFALLNYAYLFVNAALAVPTAAATVVALRLAADPARARTILRSWAPLAGIIVGGGVLLVWVLLGWEPVVEKIEAAATWDMAGSIRPIVLIAAPFAALRLANTVGRQARVAADPRGLLPWDVAGTVVRMAVLIFGSLWVGVLASPLALVVGEVFQLGAWLWWSPPSAEHNG